MDHRLGRRYHLKLDVNVNVYKDNMYIGPAMIRDISHHGAFLESDPWRLTTHSIVKIILTSNNKHEDKIIQKGLVIHHSSEGVGLMFLDNQLEPFPISQINVG